MGKKGESGEGGGGGEGPGGGGCTGAIGGRWRSGGEARPSAPVAKSGIRRAAATKRSTKTTTKKVGGGAFFVSRRVRFGFSILGSNRCVGTGP